MEWLGMTLDQLQQRDVRIAQLESLGRDGRTRAQDRELGTLVSARDAFWRRLPTALAVARRKAAELDAYARQHRLCFPPA